MRAVLLLDEQENVSKWQYDALRWAIDNGLEVVRVAHCLNSPPRRVTIKNCAYYLFAYMSHLGVKTTQLVNLSDLLDRDTPRTYFEAQTEGMWQRVPEEISELFNEADVIIKFGMSLLAGADSLPVTHGVLSYHHGDPERYRGRPAGYYEQSDKALVQGVIVQRITDTLDGGEVLAKSYSRVVPHSYGKTVEAAHLAGIPLLAKAIQSIQTSQPGDTPDSLGPKYRLPTTAHVLRQSAHLAIHKISRLAYGAFKEKRWLIGYAKTTLDPERDLIIKPDDVESIDLPAGFDFAADPISDGSGGFYCELFRSSDQGQIAYYQQNKWYFDVLEVDGHASYPDVVTNGGVRYIVPEIATFSAPKIYPTSEIGEIARTPIELQGLEHLRLIDPTLFRHEDRWYLFASHSESAASRLELWSANKLEGPYELHPASPICVDPRGSRMAGPIAALNGGLYRFGQDVTKKYGGRVTTYKIADLSENGYTETACGSIRFAGLWGPHTVNVTNIGLLVDYFTERTSMTAGLTRIKSMYAARRISGVSLK